MSSLRDVLVTLTIVGSLPFCFMRPWIGILVWVWFGTMNPHRMTWGFAYNYPFAGLIAMATMAGILFARDRQPLPQRRETYLLLALWAHFALTTFFASYPDEAWPQFVKVSKIFLFTFIGLVFFQDRARLRYLLLVLALSIGFFGVKGGIWAILTGGTERVEGPEGAYVGGNTGVALGLDIALPLLYFLAREESNVWLRRALWLCVICAIPAVIFSYSRGGLLGLVAVVVLMAIKTNRKFVTGVGFAVVFVGVLALAPQKWFDRTDTIVNYKGEGSAESRLMAWGVAFRYTLDHPLLGGGFFATARDDVYLKYIQEAHAHVPHSIWFSMLSEHGFPGAILFASLLISSFATLRALRRRRHGRPPPAPWVVNYSHMLEVSIAGYAVAGTFLNAAYMDIFYWLVAMVVLLSVIAAREARAAAATPRPTSPEPKTPAAPPPAALTRYAFGSPGGPHVWHRRLR